MSKESWTQEELKLAFGAKFAACVALMLQKNSDYGNSWYDDRPTTLTDTIKHKIDRIISIEEKRKRGESPAVGTETYAEQIRRELEDIINYCVFRDIKLNETGE